MSNNISDALILQRAAERTMLDGEAVILHQQEIEALLPHRGKALILDDVIVKGKTAKGYFAIHPNDSRIVDHFGTAPGVLLAEFAHLTAATMVCWSSDSVKRVLPVLLTSQIDVTTKMGVFPGDRLECNVEQYSNLWARFQHFLLLRRCGFASNPAMRSALKDVFFPDSKTPYFFFRARITHRDGMEAACVRFTGVRVPIRLLLRHQRHAAGK